MTDIEQKALALVNEVADDSCHEMDDARFNEVCSALYLSIEQHEAFRQEVSDAVEAYVGTDNYLGKFNDTFGRFIIAKPDPLVEALDEIGVWGPDRIDRFRAAIAKRSGKIVWGD